jgi:CubicO group peptidase (beta-lactamase class C family)
MLERTMVAPDRTRPRVKVLHGWLTAAAQELVDRAAIGVALRIELPGMAEPVCIAAGSFDAAGSAPLTGEELHSIASQSKMFTAACVLLLARDGAIALDDAVAKYVPDVPAVDADATIAQFLSHTSGIGNFIHALTVLPHPWPSLSYDDIMALAKMHGRQFRAGNRLDYNNTDVVVLARLCERVAGQGFERLLADCVLAPLGMHDTYVASGADWPRARMARGYYLPSQAYAGPPVDVATLPDYSIASAAGNIVSTLPDMLRFARGLLGKEGPLGLGLGDFATGVADAGRQYPMWFLPRTYGRGVECWNWGGRRFWGHRGSFFGYHSATFVEPASQLALSLFMTLCTAGSFMRFIEREAYDYMAFLAAAAQAAADAVELP